MLKRNDYFSLLRRIKSEYEKETATLLKPSSHDHFMNYCEDKYGFRPYLNFAGFTEDYRVINEGKFNWYLLKRQ